MTRQLPAVTVMMAAYNSAGFIHRSLDSALAQDYPPELLDIVIVDDGSTDDTPEVLTEYQRRHPDRITVIRQENAGYVAATNTAPAAARGELLAELDADDLWPPHKTRLQVARLLEDDAIGLVYCDTEVIDPYDAVLRQSVWEWLEQDPQRGPGAFAQIMARPGNVALSSTIMLRAELADDVFPIPLRAPYQDWWVTARIAAVAKSTGWTASRPAIASTART
jgi:glycosyltransferase involved in cell wall biosynthesis